MTIRQKGCKMGEVEDKCKVVIISPDMTLTHEFYMNLSRKEVSQKLKEVIASNIPFITIETNTREYIYPREWLVHHAMIIILSVDEEEKKEEEKNPDYKKSVGKVIKFEDYHKS